MITGGVLPLAWVQGKLEDAGRTGLRRFRAVLLVLPQSIPCGVVKAMGKQEWNVM